MPTSGGIQITAGHAFACAVGRLTFSQIKPAKTNLSLFGRLLVLIGAVIGQIRDGENGIVNFFGRLFSGR